MAPSHYLNQCWNIINWTLRNKLQWNFNRNSNIFIHENALENVVCEMASILSRPKCVNRIVIKPLRVRGYWQFLSSHNQETYCREICHCHHHFDWTKPVLLFCDLNKLHSESTNQKDILTLSSAGARNGLMKYARCHFSISCRAIETRRWRFYHTMGCTYFQQISNTHVYTWKNIFPSDAHLTKSYISYTNM